MVEIGTVKMKTLWLLTCIPPPGLMGANFLNSSSSCAGQSLSPTQHITKKIDTNLNAQIRASALLNISQKKKIQKPNNYRKP